MSNLDDFMFSEGWKKTIITHSGRDYIHWDKKGFEIDEEEICDMWSPELREENEVRGK